MLAVRSYRWRECVIPGSKARLRPGPRITRIKTGPRKNTDQTQPRKHGSTRTKLNHGTRTNTDQFQAPNDSFHVHLCSSEARFDPVSSVFIGGSFLIRVIRVHPWLVFDPCLPCSSVARFLSRVHPWLRPSVRPHWVRRSAAPSRPSDASRSTVDRDDE